METRYPIYKVDDTNVYATLVWNVFLQTSCPHLDFQAQEFLMEQDVGGRFHRALQDPEAWPTISPHHFKISAATYHNTRDEVSFP